MEAVNGHKECSMGLMLWLDDNDDVENGHEEEVDDNSDNKAGIEVSMYSAMFSLICQTAAWKKTL